MGNLESHHLRSTIVDRPFIIHFSTVSLILVLQNWRILLSERPSLPRVAISQKNEG